MSDLDQVHALVARDLQAYAAQDAKGVAATFTEDARLHSPFGPPAIGRSAIAATHVVWFRDRERDKVMQVVEAETSGAIGSALVGFAATVDGAGGQPERIDGMSLNTLRRDPRGAWHIRICCLTLFDTPPEGFPT